MRAALLYTEQLAGLRDKVVFDLGEESYPAFYESTLAGLEGVALAVDDECWMRMTRLAERPPPPLPPLFNGWVSPTEDPLQHPALLAERVLQLTAEEMSEHAEAGFQGEGAGSEGAVTPSQSGAADLFAPDQAAAGAPLELCLRTAEMPELSGAWGEFVAGPWSQWEALERPRRQSIKTYNALFQIQQRMTAGGEDNAIELVWGVGIARWRHAQRSLSIPLIEQPVEIELDADANLRVRPRPLPPRLTLKAFEALGITAAASLEREEGDRLTRIAEDADVGFSPFATEGVKAVLSACVAHLSPTGVYWAGEAGESRPLPPLGPNLIISDGWVLFVRRRAQDVRKADIRGLMRAVEAAKDDGALPPIAARLVTPPADERLHDDLPDLDAPLVLPEPERIVPARDSVATSEDRPTEPVFFPLPYNDEQLQILSRLRHSDGVVVQGPPGTGKTHSIANIVCHYLAHGRRVLVTARTAEALTALQEKLPATIRPLAIAIIHNDREGARQLEHAVELLANEAKRLDSGALRTEIQDRQKALAELDKRIAELDTLLAARAAANLGEYMYDGRRLLPMELAGAVAEGRSRHGWFPDRPDGDQPSVADALGPELRRLRAELGADLLYTAPDLPPADAVPDTGHVLAAHDALARARTRDARRQDGTLPYMAADPRAATEVREWLQGLAAFIEVAQPTGWVLQLYRLLAAPNGLDAPTRSALMQSLGDWVRLGEEGRALLSEDVDLGTVPPDDAAFDEAVAVLARGGQPFGLLSFGKAALKSAIASVRVAGATPVGAGHWTFVARQRAWNSAARRFARAWKQTALASGLPTLGSDADVGTELLRAAPLLAELLRFLGEGAATREALQLLFPYGLDVDAAIGGAAPGPALDAVEANLADAEADDAERLRKQLLAAAGAEALPLQARLRDLARRLGDAEETPGSLAAEVALLRSEATRLARLRPLRASLDKLTAEIAAAGAPLWAALLAREPAGAGEDRLLPETWPASWAWAQADAFLHRLTERENGRALEAEQRQLEARRLELLAEIVRLRTFYELKRRMTGRIEAALAKFASAMRRLGAGTGQSAGRHRRILREAALDAASAVPCWIMPEWRVAEQLPPELGGFDLVVVDEASQSDITALPVLMRGAAVLIVGDDKQVSPLTIGVEDRTIVQLRTSYLTGLPFADQMDPATSLYELGAMLFPGRTIMLREHFRCVEPIIRFSSRFYPSPLVPMRLPTAAERLDPPLVDIYVPDGMRDGDVNRPEAAVILDEIAAIATDPALAHRSVGVISLLGDKQAKLIQDGLLDRIGAEAMIRHRLLCGSAAAFQGQERDIIFLSLVQDRTSATMQRARIYEQRFNVALSRARDRMVLVRSIAASDLKSGDLKLEIIEHFRDPMAGVHPAPEAGRGLLDACESGLEREFAEEMLDRGWRLRAQVPVAGFRIDFVIEGAGDRRLAVELDGDRWHGPDRWLADHRRQRALERFGWTFWRCWGTDWVSDRSACLEDLSRTLARLGIEPLGQEGRGVGPDIWTEHRRVAASPALLAPPC